MFWSEWAFLPDHSLYSASLLGMVKDFFSNITQEGLNCWIYNGTDQITAAEATSLMTKDKQTEWVFAHLFATIFQTKQL